MATESENLALLITCPDAVEAGALQARLESAGIPVVMQGGMHAAMTGGVLAGLVEARLLVPSEDLERAKAMLDAWEHGDEVKEEVPAGAEVTDTARCVRHRSAATGTCSRCGAFVCEACAAGSDAAVLCLDCEDRLFAERPRTNSVRAWAVALMVGPLLFLMLLGLLALVRAAFRA